MGIIGKTTRNFISKACHKDASCVTAISKKLESESLRLCNLSAFTDGVFAETCQKSFLSQPWLNPAQIEKNIRPTQPHLISQLYSVNTLKAGDGTTHGGIQTFIEAEVRQVSGSFTSSPIPSSCKLTPMEKEHLSYVNADRKENGQRPLKIDCALMIAARNYSAQMWRDNHFDHTGADGSTPITRIESVTQRFRATGENLAYFGSPPSPQLPYEMENGLIHHEGHRENLLNPLFTYIGIGFYLGSDNRIYLTQDFGGLPKS